MRIGVVALQGAWQEHANLLEQRGVEAIPLRRRPFPEGLSGVVLPGGESTVIGRHLTSTGLHTPLGDAVISGMPILGTCAGAILLATSMEGTPPQGRIPLVPFRALRNAFGSQRESFEGMLDWRDGTRTRGVFIRAPRFAQVDSSVETLACFDDDPVALRWKNVFLAAFHPEVNGDTKLHDLFLDACRDYRAKRA